jgi:hypothetical protein
VRRIAKTFTTEDTPQTLTPGSPAQFSHAELYSEVNCERSVSRYIG